MNDRDADRTALDTMTESDGADAKFFPLPRGTAVGRYIIVDFVDRGGMGAVYKAFDPDLNRSVALKLLTPLVISGDASRDSSQIRGRLLREAQALAQLSHPNVVAVHDVGTFHDGHQGETVFMALEFVEGQTLHERLAGGLSTRKELLEILVAAGRGLAAAHAAGIVHRDFKPANVMIGKDGRVRVLDFGLAKGREPGSDIAAVASDGDKPSARDEAAFSLESGPREDTSSTFDLGAGGRELPSETGQEPPGSLLSLQLTQAGAIMGTPYYMAPEQHLGQPTDAKSDQFSFCVVLHEILCGARPFSGRSSKEVLAEILKWRRSPQSAAPEWLMKVVERGLRPDPADRFPSMDVLLDELTNDPEITRARLRAKRLRWAGGIATLGFAVLGIWGIWSRTTQAERMCAGGEARLATVWDRAVRRSVKMRFDATGRSYAADTFERVARLLDAYAAHWVEQHRDACEATHVRGEQSAELLDLRMECLERRRSQLRALTGLFAQSAETAVLDRSIQAVQELEDLGACASAELLRAEIPLPKDPRAQARIQALRASLDNARALHSAGQYAQAARAVEDILEEVRGVGYPPLLAEALLWLGTCRTDLDQIDAARTSLQEAARLYAQNELDEGLARAWARLVFTDYQLGHYDAAIEAGLLAETMAVRVKDTQLEAHLLGTMGLANFRRGGLTPARSLLERAVGILERDAGPQSLPTANLLNNLGLVEQAQGDFETALDHLRRAIAIWEATLGEGHPDLALAVNNLGVALFEMKRYPEAEAQYLRARAIWERSLGPDHRYMAMVENNLGEVAIGLGRFEQALKHCERALRIGRERLPPAHSVHAYHLTCLGNAYLGLGKPVDAIGPLAEAVTMRATSGGSTSELSQVRFLLARALWESGRERPRALKLARQALEAIAPGDREQAGAPIQAWLSARQDRTKASRGG